MSQISHADEKLLELLARLAFSNPFSIDRIRLEREILDERFVFEDATAWSRRPNVQANDRPNVVELTRRAAEVVERVRAHLTAGHSLTKTCIKNYWESTAYLMLYRHITVISASDLWDWSVRNDSRMQNVWRGFLADFERLLNLPPVQKLIPTNPAHMFAACTQVHRAFFQIFDHILGDSLPAAELRARVWESIFTYDLARYYRSLWPRMREISTLITGPSGTGKELVARAIGLSSYFPFDGEKQKFSIDFKRNFFPVNLSALSRTLIESELFGHRKGSFTGALADRPGWLETCGPQGAVFLDEIGELDSDLQVKLLRVLQQRTFNRLGETDERAFVGKMIAATNRDLRAEISAGRFREDLYFRICADRIETPSLRQQLDHRPADLQFLVYSIAHRISAAEATTITEVALDWIHSHLGEDYPWQGNIRELEQCVWNIVVHRSYVPMRTGSTPTSTLPEWIQGIVHRRYTAEEILQKYCTWVYTELGSYEQTARHLGLDRRTVKAKIDEGLVAQWKPPAT